MRYSIWIEDSGETFSCRSHSEYWNSFIERFNKIFGLSLPLDSTYEGAKIPGGAYGGLFPPTGKAVIFHLEWDCSFETDDLLTAKFVSLFWQAINSNEGEVFDREKNKHVTMVEDTILWVMSNLELVRDVEGWKS